jgi:hypothetical protein
MLEIVKIPFFADGIYNVEWNEKCNPKYGGVSSEKRKCWLIFSYYLCPS